MKFLPKFLQKKSNSIQELLSYPVFGPVLGGFDIDSQELLAAKALLFYRIISPVNTGIDLIAEEFANLSPVVYDTKKKTYVDHEVLDLLSHPYGDVTWREFATEMATYFLVTGNNYLSASGNVNRPPIELMNLYPGAVSILASTKDGYNETYLVTLAVGSTQYNRTEKLVPGYFRYVNANESKELWHIKSFNPNSRPGLAYYGMSQLTGIFYEIEQYLLASKHNRALLRNGAKLSTVFITDTVLKPETYKRLKDQLAQFVGPDNAGKSMIFEQGLDAKELGLSNKDMDFLLLKKDMALAIFNKMRVPIPLVFPERTTMNNMEEARIQLYDNSVFPVANRILEEITEFLMPRYKGSEDLIITYKQDDIPALEPRRLDQVGKKQKLGVYTINELRAMLGDSEVDGGDEIYHTTTELPISDTDDSQRSDVAPKEAESGKQKDSDIGVEDKPVDDADKEPDVEKRVSKLIESLRFADGKKVFEPPKI